MAKMISKKLAFLIAALVIGGGALMVFMMAQPEEQVTANAKPEAIAAATVPSADAVAKDAGFLNYDMVIGNPDAPIEIIEYAAISCPHCAHFHEEVLPGLKEKYLDTGKAKLIYRNFIFDNPFDVYASILTRCVAEDKFFPTLKTYFDYQNVWMKGPEMMKIFETDGRDAAIAFARSEVAKVGKMAGISDARAEACYADENVIAYLMKLRQEAVKKYEVNSTPTLIVDGKTVEGNDLASLSQAIEEAGK